MKALDFEVVALGHATTTPSGYRPD